MDIIRESPEHHYLTMLDRIKAEPQGWMALFFALSKTLRHEDIIGDHNGIEARIRQSHNRSEAFLKNLVDRAGHTGEGAAYLFSDHDVLLLARTETAEDRTRLQLLFQETAKTLKQGLSDSGILAHDLYNYQKLADRKLISARRYQAYQAMADRNKVASIRLRRQRRENPIVLIVEDDRFTAAYTANILNKDYDLVVARTGEEGLAAYIEHAPDIVFLDIHLPGLSGHETLEAIKSVDPGAFVVMLSVDTARSNILQASQHGAQNFLKKPFSKERLINTVKSSPYIRGIFRSHDTDSLH